MPFKCIFIIEFSTRLTKCDEPTWHRASAGTHLDEIDSILTGAGARAVSKFLTVRFLLNEAESALKRLNR